MKAQYGSKKKYHYLYKTVNLINEKFYYGMHSTDNLEDGYKGSGTLLKRSINKYGINNFVIEILEFFNTRKALVEAEKKLITEIQVQDSNCMNLRPGGIGGFSKEQIRKSNIIRRRKLTEKLQDIEYNEKYREARRQKALERFETYPGNFLGRKHKPETIEKMKQHKGKSKGIKNSQFGTKWITNEKENRKIKATDQIPEGWRAGRKIK
jgi:hypothetical protein